MATPNFDLNLGEDFEQLARSGFPTFDEFRRNPEKYRKHPEEIFNWVDPANVWFKDRLKKIKFYWRDQYECDSLERVQKLSTLEGYHAHQIEAKTVARSLGGTGKHESFEIQVQFWPSWEFRLQGGIVAND